MPGKIVLISIFWMTSYIIDSIFRGTVLINWVIMGNALKMHVFIEWLFFNHIHCISWPQNVTQRASDTAFSNGYINLPFFIYMDVLHTRYPTHFNLVDVCFYNFICIHLSHWFCNSVYLFHFIIITYCSIRFWKLIWTLHSAFRYVCYKFTFRTKKWTSKSSLVPPDSVSFINYKWIHTKLIWCVAGKAWTTYRDHDPGVGVRVVGVTLWVSDR